MHFLNFLEENLASTFFAVFRVVAKEGARPDLGYCRALFWFESQEAHHKHFEVIGKASALYSLEVGVIVLFHDHVVVIIGEDFRAIGKLPLNHNEQKYTQREYVCFSGIVYLVFKDFRCNVAGRSNGTCDFREVARNTEAKVDKLEGHLIVNEDILKLEISMCNISFIVQVFESVNHLFEKVATSIFSKTSFTSTIDQVKEIQKVVAEVLSDQVSVVIFLIFHALDIRDTI